MPSAQETLTTAQVAFQDTPLTPDPENVCQKLNVPTARLRTRANARTFAIQDSSSTKEFAFTEDASQGILRTPLEDAQETSIIHPTKVPTAFPLSSFQTDNALAPVEVDYTLTTQPNNACLALPIAKPASLQLTALFVHSPTNLSMDNVSKLLTLATPISSATTTSA